MRNVKEIFCNRWPPMTNGKKWKRTGKWEPGRIGCGRDTKVEIRLWLVVRAFTLVQPFCLHCYDRYEFRKCNIVVYSVLNDNVEKFQRQKNPNSAFLPMVRFPFVRQNWPARPSLQNANFTFYKTVRGQISQFLCTMYEFDEFLSETFLKKPISFSKSPIRPASSDFWIAPARNYAVT